MLKQTLLFSNPVSLTTQAEQLRIEIKATREAITRPLQDIGFIVLDHPEIYISPPAVAQCLHYNIAVVYCDAKHIPVGMLLNLEANTLQQERFEAQVQATEPLKKQCWKQITEAKIENQARLLLAVGKKADVLLRKATQVQSGDATGQEAQAARYYWANLFPEETDFFRDRSGLPPNNLLNYGYAVLRAGVARALAGAGLLATLGLHHHNRYNAYCLADDMMEPYRPWVDRAVYEIVSSGEAYHTLTTAHKQRILAVLAENCDFPTEKSPLMPALVTSAASLVRCFAGTSRKLLFPIIQ